MASRLAVQAAAGAKREGLFGGKARQFYLEVSHCSSSTPPAGLHQAWHADHKIQDAFNSLTATAEAGTSLKHRMGQACCCNSTVWTGGLCPLLAVSTEE
jgi:hypothetical protein